MQGGNGMHTAPNPGPPIGKVHDISFDREKTLMRTIMTEGAGEEAREGSVVTVHVEIFQPDSEGQVQKIYRSKDEHPEGLRFNLFNDMHSEALDRTLWHCKPGAVIDSICTCPDIAADPKLGIFAQRLSEGAQKLWCIPQSPVGIAQGALKDPPIMQPKPEDKEPPWAPPRYVTLFHVLLDSVTPGTIPMYMIAEERLEWVEQRKLWATELFKRGMHARALRHYKKAMLDLETPLEWQSESQVVARNQLRMQLHLNCAACATKLSPVKSYPNLSSQKMHWDPHKDGIFHCTRVLNTDVRNVKALFRRALCHLALPADRHINGLAMALEDLTLAAELEPQNAEVRAQLKLAKELQKKADRDASGMFTKMLGTGVEV